MTKETSEVVTHNKWIKRGTKYDFCLLISHTLKANGVLGRAMPVAIFALRNGRAPGAGDGTSIVVLLAVLLLTSTVMPATSAVITATSTVVLATTNTCY